VERLGQGERGQAPRHRRRVRGAGLIALAIAPWLPAPAPASWPWLAGSAAVHILYFLLLAGAYRHGELSYVYPVMRGGGPMIVALMAPWLSIEIFPLKKSRVSR